MIVHFNRGLAMALEVVGILVIVLLAGSLALMLRLQQGPMQLDFLTERVERAFARHQNGFTFNIGRTELSWGGHADPFVIDMTDVRVTRSDETPVAIIRRGRVVLSKRALLVGRIVPKELYLYGPALRVVRNLDGAVTLNVGDGGSLENTAAVEKAWDETLDAPRKENAAAQKQLIAGIVKQMESPEWNGVLGGLQRVVIDQAMIAYEDRVLDVVWRAERAQVVLARHQQGVVADTIFQGNFGGDEAAAPAVIRLRLIHLSNSDTTTAEAFFTGVAPSQLARQSAKMAMAAGIELPLKGKINLTFDAEMRPTMLSFTIGSDAGRISLPDLYAAPLEIAALAVSGRYDLRGGEGELNDIRIDLGGPRIQARMHTITAENGRRVSLQGELTAMPINRLSHFWSPKLAPDAQKWVTTRLSAGIADRATVDLALLRGDDGVVTLEKLGGEIDFQGITVDYFPPLQKVTGVNGRAVYDADTFKLDMTSGKLEDMTVTNSKIDITGLRRANISGQHAQIDVAVSLAGPLKTALKVLDSEPLGYPSKLGLNGGDVAGDSTVDVTFSFPLHHALDIHEVAVAAKARIDKVRLPKVAAGFDLTGGPYELTLGKGVLRVKGKGRFGDAGIELDWSRNFSDARKPAMELAAALTAPASMLLAFGVPDALKPSGFMPAKLTLTERQDGTATLLLDGDLTPAGFSIAALGASKGEGDPGKLALELEMKNQKPVALRRLSVEAPALSLEGRIDFTAADTETKLSRAALSKLRFGATDLSEVTFAFLPAGGYDITAKGRVVDASALFADNDTPNSDEAAAQKTDPLSLSLTVDKLMTGKNRGLDAVRLKLGRNAYNRIEQLELDAMAGGKPVTARYLPATPVGKTLRFEAGNAGAALRALDITSAVQGGQLVIDAKPLVKADDPRNTGRDLAGTVVLSNFELRNAPLLAKLLNGLSLSGIYDLLNNNGLSFKKARARFTLTDRGQPHTTANQRLLRIHDGQTSGASLGLTFEGVIDLWRKSYDLNGTIVPVSDLNTLLEKIPLLGDVLTAGGEGIFAATYKITGPQKDPNVSVNPLSVLAPGVLRKIFFED